MGFPQPNPVTSRVGCGGDRMVVLFGEAGYHNRLDVELEREMGLLAPADEKPRQLSRDGGTR